MESRRPTEVRVQGLVRYVLAAMLSWVPPAAHVASEAPQRALERYRVIAEDIVAVALDEGEKPLFGGADGRARTAVLLASIASWE